MEGGARVSALWVYRSAAGPGLSVSLRSRRIKKRPKQGKKGVSGDCPAPAGPGKAEQPGGSQLGGDAAAGPEKGEQPGAAQPSRGAAAGPGKAKQPGAPQPGRGAEGGKLGRSRKGKQRDGYPMQSQTSGLQDIPRPHLAGVAPVGVGRGASSPRPQELITGPSLPDLLQELGRVQHSRHRAAKLFEWLITPISPQQFFEQSWENKPLLIRRHNPAYYQGLFSTATFDAILRDNDVQFGVNLDVTSYVDGTRETHNPVGRALPAVVWDFYRNGCSLRMLNPQAFSATIWQFLSILQEQFGSMAGANTYLTPAGTQGFAPHYDDIEAFVIQLEGKKHWRVYGPRHDTEVLPQFSSCNFAQEEIGEPILETILEAGDLLYFPRGFIHQGDCLPDAHSLHITVSSYQRNSWGDLLEKLLPATLQMAIEEDVEYRQGLPIDYLEYMGVVNSDVVDSRRGAFIERVQNLIKKLVDYAPIDAAVDQKAKLFLHDCLPPMLTEHERALSIHGLPARWEDGDVRDTDIPIKKGTQVRLLRHGIIRLCNERNGVLLYYTTENSRVYHKEEPKYLEIDPEFTDGIEFLLSSYPEYVCVETLPCDTLDDKISLATFLFEKGLLITKKPLVPM
ncbi:ribosomal oxygenase 1 [Gopherus flavomarginatus]|uniref:ribosomal oxygenase 1 n=1 Tax=Gopherus flavomarginatus TaxID=286002 RepID=UPI0021CC1841|nr:ribosomal oxygenase 1 [Gopherus flavomarginatus]